MKNLGPRVARLISGGLNAAVDAAENLSPELVMKESIREVDSAIGEIRHELGKCTILKQNIIDSLTSDKEKHSALLDKINAALRADRDDLAEIGIGKQMDLEAQIKTLETEGKENDKEIKRLEGFITALQGKKREMTEQLAIESKNATNASAVSKAEKKTDKAQEAFNRVSDHGVSDTYTDSPEVSAGLEELDELERKARIKSRLSALKSTQN